MNSPKNSNPRGGDLEAIRRAARAAATATIPAAASAAYNAEKSSYEAERRKVENDLLAEQLRNAQQDRVLREKYATWAFGYLLGYSGFCAILVVAQGRPDMAFKLSDGVIITLVGSTAIAAIGLVGWIARGLFKAPE